MQRASFIKTSLNQLHRRKVVVAVVVATRSPRLVATIKAEKQLNPQHQRQHREKRRATGRLKPKKKPRHKNLCTPV